MKTPSYNIGDSIYLRDSAALGFLESHKISGITYDQESNLTYWLETSVRPPDALRTKADAVGYFSATAIPVSESDIANLCDALDLVIEFHTVELAKFQSIKNNNCNE